MAKLLTGTRIYGTGTIDTQLFVNGTEQAVSTTTGALEVIGGAGIGGNLHIGGISVSAGVQSTNIVASGTLGVTGTSTLGVLNATSATFSGTLGVTGTSVLSGVQVSNIVASGTLGVTGTSTLAGLTLITDTTSATSITTGALVVSGGVGIGQDLRVGGVIYGTFNGAVTGTATNAINVLGGTAGQVPYQTAPGTTSFYGPGTAGNVLVSNGTSAPTYNNTLTLAGTTAATNATSGALRVAGGVGIGDNLFVNNNINAVSGQIVSTRANNAATGAGQIYLNGASGNRIDFNTNGIAAPTFTTRSTGTKLVLYPNLSGSAVDYAIGIESGTLWSSVPNASNVFKWYGGTTLVATLTGAGNLTLVGDLAVNGGDITTTQTTFGLVDATAATVNFARAATALTMGAVSGTTNVRNNLTVSGNLTVQGTTTIVDSTVTNIADPILTLGGGTGNTAPTADDNKDRGIAFKWVNNGGTTSTGFFGYDDSTGFLTYIQTATITNEVVSGTKGAVDANLAGGSAMALVYQSSANNTGFLAAGTSGYILQTNGTGSSPSWVAATGLSAGSSANSDAIRTVRQPASATYYLTFVDSNNATNAYEAVYTTSSFTINPATGNIVATGNVTAPSFSIQTNTIPAVFIKDDNLTAWDYSGKSFSISAQETGPAGIFFKPDGLAMYVIGSTGDDVNQYSLSVAWDVSTAVFVRVSVAIGETAPTGVHFKPDGSVMYIIGSTNDSVREFSLSTAWDVSTIAFVRDFSVAAQESAPQDLWFKPDGTKMYVIGSTGDDVNEYNLSIAWNVSSAVFLQTFSVAAQDSVPIAINFNADGTKMYVLGQTGQDINRYSLSTPWDISTAVFFNNFYVGFQASSPSGMFINFDGDTAYVVGSSTDAVHQYATVTDGIELVSSSGLFVDGSLYTNKNLFVTAGTRIDGTLSVSSAATLNSTLTVGSTTNLNAAVTMGTTTSAINIGTSQSTGATIIGGTAQTGGLTLGRSTGAQTVDIAVGATTNGTIKLINVGANGVSGSTTNINVGSTVAGALGTLTINSTQTIIVATTPSDSTTTGALQVVGGVGIGGDLNVGGTINGNINGTATNSTNADAIRTVARTTNASHYLTFVDSNNASNTYESLYTTSSFSINPSTGNVSIGGRTEGIWLGNVGDNGAYDNVKIYYTGYNSGAPQVILQPRTTPGSGVLATAFYFKNSNGSSTVSNNRADVYIDGNVGIGTATPGARLDIQANDGGDTRSIQTVLPPSASYNPPADNTPGKVVSGIRFNWYSDHWQIGAARSGGTAVDGFVISRNSTSTVAITANGAIAFGLPTAYGTSGQVLQSNGNAAPTWVNASTLASGSATNADAIRTVERTTSADHFLTFVDSNNASNAYESLYTTSSFVVNPQSGNVGIGTASPIAKLTVEGQAYFADDIVLRDGATASGDILVRIYDSSDDGIIDVYRNNAVVNRIHGNGSSYFTAGNVGIGTSSPVNTLEVKGTFGGPATTGSAQNGIARFSQTLGGGSLDIGFGDPYSWIQSRQSSDYSTNYRIALNPNGGNVCIGTTSTLNKFEVAGTAGQLFSVSDSFTGTIFSVNDVSGIPSIEVLDTGLVKIAQYNGQVGISTGTVVSGSALSVYGIISTIGTGGEIRASSEITAYYSSDSRLKENIKLIENPITIIDQIRGVTFDWTDEHMARRGGEDGYFVRKHDMGVIAQEVQAVLPELVGTREDGYLAVKYEKMVPLLIEAIKAQQKTIDSLVKDLDNVKEFIDQIKNKNGI